MVECGTGAVIESTANQCGRLVVEVHESLQHLIPPVGGICISMHLGPRLIVLNRT